MRWTEIEAHAAEREIPTPTYRLMDKWTREGLLTSENRGDRHGRYRWWPPAEVEVALAVARLTAVGLTVELAFTLARMEPDSTGARTTVDVSARPPVTVSVSWG